MSVSLEQAEYILSVELERGFDYFFAYQRCCRSLLITNLSNSFENGFALTLEVNSKALEVDHDSPSLAGTPFSTAIVKEPISFQTPISIDDQMTYLTSHSAVFISGGTVDVNNMAEPRCCECLMP